jgi:hypothetical protein
MRNGAGFAPGLGRATGRLASMPCDSPSLNLTAYIDFLLVTVIFLLTSFNDGQILKTIKLTSQYGQ